MVNVSSHYIFATNEFLLRVGGAILMGIPKEANFMKRVNG